MHLISKSVSFKIIRKFANYFSGCNMEAMSYNCSYQ